ncbi:hypothetical protein I4U23_005073 [Adineta vaga]|nr:hypothetical protein I4U23_005073 [Adineta vaga]
MFFRLKKVHDKYIQIRASIETVRKKIIKQAFLLQCEEQVLLRLFRIVCDYLHSQFFHLSLIDNKINSVGAISHAIEYNVFTAVASNR